MMDSDFMVVPGLVDRCEALYERSSTGPGKARDGDLILASGWIVSLDAPIERVWVSVDRDRGYPARLGFARPDVVEIGFEAGLLSGFQAVVPIEGWNPGEHALTVEAIDIEGHFLRGEGAPYIVDVVDGGVSASSGAISKIDEVRVDDVVVDPAEPLVTGPNSNIFVRGWMIAPELADGVGAFLRSERLIPLSYGVERTDVATVYGGNARNCGFVASLDRAAFGDQACRYDLVLLTADGRSLVVSNSSLEFSALSSA